MPNNVIEDYRGRVIVKGDTVRVPIQGSIGSLAGTLVRIQGHRSIVELESVYRMRTHLAVLNRDMVRWNVEDQI